MFLALTLFLTIGTAGAATGQAAQGEDRFERDRLRRRAVVQPNLRVRAGYAGRFVEETEATNASSGLTSTLEFDGFDTHLGLIDATLTLPVTHSSGARFSLEGGFGSESRDDTAGSPDSETGTFGAGFDVFVRDPNLGAFTLGAGYERFEGDDDYEANAYEGRAELDIFFPDLGSGPVDWFVHFSFARRDDASAPRTFEPNRDLFSVEGGAGWYFGENLQWVLGGRWSLAESDDAEIEIREGFTGFRWFMPVQEALSVEFDLGGFAGISDYQEDPFRSDGRFAYGFEGGVTLRFRSGATLLESVRAHD
ncbi:MAG: hypothetical protein AB8G23_16020 [Myxococcota bacterium]